MEQLICVRKLALKAWDNVVDVLVVVAYSIGNTIETVAADVIAVTAITVVADVVAVTAVPDSAVQWHIAVVLRCAQDAI